MTTRLPANGDARISPTLAAPFLEDTLRPSVDEKAGHTLAQIASLIGGSRGGVPDALQAVDRADARFQNEFAALDTGPCAERHLATTLQRGQQGTLGHDGGARFGVIQFLERFCGLRIVRTALHGDGALA